LKEGVRRRDFWIALFSCEYTQWPITKALMKRFLQDPKTTTLPNQAHGKPTNYQGEYLQLKKTNKLKSKIEAVLLRSRL
ncbi:hypothetical protein CLOP_g15494, partial [Closterium sp. NIES-67]